LGDWKVETFNEGGSPAKSLSVTLNGVGYVLYEVNDDLELTQTERQGAICTGLNLELKVVLIGGL
jgi:hypothetical protein